MNEPATLVILAGGAGTRMGTPKALLRVNDESILAWQLRRLAWHGPTMLVTASAVARPDGSILFSRVVVDPVDGLGPLRGVLTALENMTTDTIVAMTVDMPNVRHEHLQWLATRLNEADSLGVMTRGGGRVQPFPVALRKAAVETVRANVDGGKLSVFRLSDEKGFSVIDAPPWEPATYDNLNDREAFDAFCQRFMKESR